MQVRRIAAFLIVSVALVVAKPAFAEDDPMEVYDRIDDLKQDISILNLLNGLHLTDGQQSKILGEATAARALKRRYLERKSSLLAKAEESFSELKRSLIDSQTPPPKEVTSAARRNSAELKRLHKSYVRELAGMEKRVAKVLTDGQKEILVDFKPCLIPPKNLKNPTRAGQAHDHSRIEKFLSKSRQWSDDVYERRLELYLDKYIGKVEEELGPLSANEELKEKDRVRAIVEEAQTLSDIEFELSRAELAERIDPRKEKQDKPVAITKGKRRGQIGRFLLSDRAVPLLEQRVRLASAPRYLAATDLDSITPAEDCREACAPK